MGRVKYIETPEKLWEYYTQYKEWTKANPILKQDYVGKDADEVYRKLERPLSFEGFEVYLRENDIICDLGDYDKNKDDRYTDYAPILRACKKDIEVNQFNGATVGIFQQNIIARKLGLVDKKEVTEKTVTVKVPGEDAS
jgi:hypothetical protein